MANGNGNGLHLKINSALIITLIIGAIGAYIHVRIELIQIAAQHMEMLHRLERIEARQ